MPSKSLTSASQTILLYPRARARVRLDYTVNFTTHRRGAKTLETLENKWFYEKMTIAGNIITVRKYEKLNVAGGGKVERPENGTGKDKEENYKKTQKRRRESVRNLCTTNFSCMDKFVTLTFRNNLDFDICNPLPCDYEFMKFIQRLKRWLHKNHPGQTLKYLAVIEFQDKNGRGAVHYHLLMNVPYIKKSELAKIWGLGFVKINAIDKVTNIGAYVSKYMVEDMDDERLQGKQAYLCSRSLLDPIELCSWRSTDESALLDMNDSLKSISPSYGRTYESDNAGVIVYEQYNLGIE